MHFLSHVHDRLDPRHTRSGFGARATAAVRATLLAACLVPALAGCAGIHLSAGADHASGDLVVGDAMGDADKSAATDVVTGAVGSAGTLAYAGSAPADWDLIRSTVTASLASPATAHIEWSNRTTGDTGTISDLTASAHDGPRDCRKFASTIAGIEHMGIRADRPGRLAIASRMCRAASHFRNSRD